MSSAERLKDASEIHGKEPICFTEDFRQRPLAPLGFVVQGNPETELLNRIQAPGYILIAQDLELQDDRMTPQRRIERHRKILKCEDVIPLLLLYVESEEDKPEDSFVFCILSLKDIMFTEKPGSLLNQVQKNPYSIEQESEEHMLWKDSKLLAYYVITGQMPSEEISLAY